MSSSFALGVVKVVNSATLLGTPTLTDLYTDALHIGLWNSLENDFVMIAACLPSIMPFVAFCERFIKRSHLLKSPSRQNDVEEHALEIVRNGQLPGSTDRIHIKRDFIMERKLVKSEIDAIPRKDDQVWERRQWVGDSRWATASFGE